MAVDPELNGRFRAALDGIPCISEKPMMGATCFFHHGNMLGGADRAKTGERRFLFRVGPDGAEEALSRPGARPAELGTRTMRGLVFVEAEACDADALRDWVDLAMDYVWALPAKR
ncbi:TfoX/Sxy family protein [Thalassobaculum sp. OXR-137]|uniref:TfoX/Sxy family protein n=1 Tax=Thalassobaculum sp. OXR-137 TaxID=3100173 RepID=UPI002AC9E9F7|nr:TfoX/Sxy family protein [Thalassobaculum sp. OXR-137]WPZ36521.1 TfoX/Sxy family protein [Thalassobaculum sp. OXR-137]